MIRPADPSEHNFVRKVWIRTYASSDWALLCTPKDDEHTVRCESCGRRYFRESRRDGATIAHAGPTYWSGQHELIDRLIGRCNVSVAQGDDGLLDGFVVREHGSDVVHYAYVKPYMRGKGIARALLPARGIASHMGRRGLMPGYQFNPYEAFR